MSNTAEYLLRIGLDLNAAEASMRNFNQTQQSLLRSTLQIAQQPISIPGAGGAGGPTPQQFGAETGRRAREAEAGLREGLRLQGATSREVAQANVILTSTLRKGAQESATSLFGAGTKNYQDALNARTDFIINDFGEQSTAAKLQRTIQAKRSTAENAIASSKTAEATQSGTNAKKETDLGQAIQQRIDSINRKNQIEEGVGQDPRGRAAQAEAAAITRRAANQRKEEGIFDERFQQERQTLGELQGITDEQVKAATRRGAQEQKLTEQRADLSNEEFQAQRSELRDNEARTREQDAFFKEKTRQQERLRLQQEDDPTGSKREAELQEAGVKTARENRIRAEARATEALNLDSINIVRDAELTAQKAVVTQRQIAAQNTALAADTNYTRALAQATITARVREKAERQAIIQLSRNAPGLNTFDRLQLRFGGGGLGGAGGGGAAGFFGGGALTTLKFAGASAALFGAFRALSDTVKDAVELERLFIRVNAQLTNIAAINAFGTAAEQIEQVNESLERFRQTTFQISKDTGVAATEIAELQSQFLGLFQNQEAGQQAQVLAEAATRIGAEFSVVAGVNFVEIFNDLTAGAKAFADDDGAAVVATLDEMTNAMIAVRNVTGVSGKELSDFVGRVAPAAEQAGFTLQELSAIGASLLQASGVAGAGLAEQFGRILSTFVETAGRDLAELALAFPEIGIDAEAIFSGDVRQTILDLIDNFGKLEEATQRQIIADLGSRREGATLAAILQNRVTFQAALTGAISDTSARQNEFNKITETTQIRLQKLIASFKEIAQQIFDSGIADLLNLALEAGLEFANVIDNSLVPALRVLDDVINLIPDGLGEVAAQTLALIALFKILKVTVGTTAGVDVAGSGIAGLISRRVATANIAASVEGGAAVGASTAGAGAAATATTLGIAPATMVIAGIAIGGLLLNNFASGIREGAERRAREEASKEAGPSIDRFVRQGLGGTEATQNQFFAAQEESLLNTLRNAGRLDSVWDEIERAGDTGIDPNRADQVGKDFIEATKDQFLSIIDLLLREGQDGLLSNIADEISTDEFEISEDDVSGLFESIATGVDLTAEQYQLFVALIELFQSETSTQADKLRELISVSGLDPNTLTLISDIPSTEVETIEVLGGEIDDLQKLFDNGQISARTFGVELEAKIESLKALLAAAQASGKDTLIAEIAADLSDAEGILRDVFNSRITADFEATEALLAAFGFDDEAARLERLKAQAEALSASTDIDALRENALAIVEAERDLALAEALRADNVAEGLAILAGVGVDSGAAANLARASVLSQKAEIEELFRDFGIDAGELTEERINSIVEVITEGGDLEGAIASVLRQRSGQLGIEAIETAGGGFEGLDPEVIAETAATLNEEAINKIQGLLALLGTDKFGSILGIENFQIPTTAVNYDAERQVLEQGSRAARERFDSLEKLLALTGEEGNLADKANRLADLVQGGDLQFDDLTEASFQLLEIKEQILQAQADGAENALSAVEQAGAIEAIDVAAIAGFIGAAINDTSSAFSAFLSSYYAGGITISNNMIKHMASLVAGGATVLEALKQAFNNAISNLQATSIKLQILGIDNTAVNKEIGKLKAKNNSFNTFEGDPNFGIPGTGGFSLPNTGGQTGGSPGGSGDSGPDPAEVARDLARAKLELLKAQAGDDAVKLAEIAIQEAELAASEAETEADKIRAQAQRIRADRQLEDALKELADAGLDVIDAQVELSISIAEAAGNQIEAARLRLRLAEQELNRLIADDAPEAEIIRQQARVVQQQDSLQDAILNDRISELAYLFEIDQITKKQYVNYLRALQRTLDPETQVQQFRDIERTIRSLQSDLSTGLQFNLPGSIDLPTVYEARRFGSAGFGTAGLGGATIQDNRQITITVNVADGTGLTSADVVQIFTDNIGTNRFGYTIGRY